MKEMIAAQFQQKHFLRLLSIILLNASIPVVMAQVSAAPGSYVIERVQQVSAESGAHKIFSTPVGPAPARWSPFIQSQTGHRITRISDVSQIQDISPAYPYEGINNRGMTNGYSKYSCVNQTGEYVLAYGVQPWVNGLYRLSDGAYIRQVK